MVDDDSGMITSLTTAVAPADNEYRYTSTTILTICRKPSRVSSAQCLVFLDVSRSTVSVPQTMADLSSSLAVSSTSKPKAT
jgi:hypothetical protein